VLTSLIMLQVCQLNRRFSLFIVGGLLLVVVAASLAVLYEKGFCQETLTKLFCCWVKKL
jgi:hypothetical protein